MSVAAWWIPRPTNRPYSGMSSDRTVPRTRCENDGFRKDFRPILKGQFKEVFSALTIRSTGRGLTNRTPNFSACTAARDASS